MVSKIETHRIHHLTGHQNPIYTVEVGSFPDILYTAGNDKGVVEWNSSSGTFNRVLTSIKSSAYALKKIPDQSLLAVGERSGLVSLVDIRSGAVAARLELHQKPIFSIHYLSAKKELLVGSEDGSVSVWSVANFQLLYRFQVSTQTVRTMAVSPDEESIAIGSKDGYIRIYFAKDFLLRQEIKAHDSGVTALSYAPDGQMLLSGGRDARLSAYVVKEHYTATERIKAHLFSIYAIAYHPTLPIFVTASRDKSAKLWRSEDFSLIKVISMEKGLDAHRLSLNHALWDEQGRLITISDDKSAMVWQINAT